MTPVERVARAIHQTYMETAAGAVGGRTWDSLSEWERRFGLGLARAALAAMREPSEGMVEAGSIAAERERFATAQGLLAYRAMIDKALEEG